MTGYYLQIGHTCAAAFTTKRALFRALPAFAIGINVEIKRGEPKLPNVARRQKAITARKYPRMLKRGEFKL